VRRRDLVLAVPLLPLAAQAQMVDLNDAINKAGRQRMLSQRMAKSYLAGGLGVERAQAERTLSASIAMFERQLVELSAFAPKPEIKATYQQLDAAWGDYKAVLVGEQPARARAASVLALSGKVLKLANDGTGQLEKVSQKPAGRLVNLCGRQRMLSQRMAAYYLSACWDVQPQLCSAELAKAREEFIAAHEVLKRAPETTAAIQEQLAMAALQWTFFDNALRTLQPGGSDKQAMANVFTTSERILQLMDGVTNLYSKLG